jgi:CheY-like chemotaxis protein
MGGMVKQQAGASAGKLRTVLIVEDDQLFRKALMTYLSSLGFETCGVSTAEDALREAAWTGVDVVLIDYFLPGMNGIELAQALSARNVRARMMLMSGYLPPAVREQAAASIEDVLCKPHDMSLHGTSGSIGERGCMNPHSEQIFQSRKDERARRTARVGRSNQRISPTADTFRWTMPG